MVGCKKYPSRIFKNSKMTIERTNEEIIIRLPNYVNIEGLQRLVDDLTYREATAQSKAIQADVDDLAKMVKKGWWAANKKRLIQ
jgi:hypothetical protein